MYIVEHDERRRRLRFLLRLLGQEYGLYVGQHTALSDRHAGQELVEFLVVSDRQLQVTRNDPRLLVVSGGVTGQLQNFGGQIFHYGREVYGRAGTDSLRVVAFAEKTMYTTHGKLQSGAARPRLRLALYLSTLSSSRHIRSGLSVIRS